MISVNSASSVKVFLTLVFLLTTSAAIRSYSARTCPAPDAFGVEGARMRMHEIAAQLPAGEIVGYVSDLPTNEHAGDTAIHAVQYVLAPRIIVVDMRHRPPAKWVIGNFARPADFVRLGQERGLRLFRDFGNGVVLYQRALK